MQPSPVIEEEMEHGSSPPDSIENDEDAPDKKEDSLFASKDEPVEGKSGSESEGQGYVTAVTDSEQDEEPPFDDFVSSAATGSTDNAMGMCSSDDVGGYETAKTESEDGQNDDFGEFCTTDDAKMNTNDAGKENKEECAPSSDSNIIDGPFDSTLADEIRLHDEATCHDGKQNGLVKEPVAASYIPDPETSNGQDEPNHFDQIPEIPSDDCIAEQTKEASVEQVDDFGGSSPEEVDEPESLNKADCTTSVKQTEHDTDDFGVFASSSMEILTAEAQPEQTKEAPVSQEDDFGAFGAFKEPNKLGENLATNDQVEGIAPVSTNNDEAADFTSPGTDISSPELESQQINEKSDSDTQEDDFGDFSAVSDRNEEESSTTAIDKVDVDASAEPVTTELKDNDQEEVDDARAQVSPTEEVSDENNDAPDSQDDDFGDLNAFNEPATEDAQLEQDGPVEPVTTDDDGFGDFGTFKQAENDTHVVPEADKQVESTQLEAPEKLEAFPEQVDDDDDDFGDFEDFTDFSTGQDNSEQNAEVASSVATSAQKDANSAHTTGTQEQHAAPAESVSEKAESVFSNVFGRHVKIEDAKDDQDASSRTIISISSVLTPLVESASNCDEPLSLWCTGALASVLNESRQSEAVGSIAVANVLSEYPYAHYAVSVGGLPMSQVETAPRSTERRGTQCKPVAKEPKVEPQATVPTSSSTEPSSNSSALHTEGTVVKLPPVKTEEKVGTQFASEEVDFAKFQSPPDVADTSSSKEEAPEGNGKKPALSGTATQFLKQIPDLSFMLKSKLTLPNQS